MRRMLLLITCLPVWAFAQQNYQLIACSGVNSNGDCINKGDIFSWNGENLKLTLRLQSAATLSTSKLYFKIFKMRNDKEGDIYSELSLYTRPEWTSGNKDVYFVSPGYYKIEAYNEQRLLVESTYITVTDRPL